MSGMAWAAVAGVLFGVFQSVNRAALVDMDIDAAVFIQLFVCSAFMIVALALDGGSGLSELTGTAVLNFSLAGLIHFLIGWTLLNISQKRLGAARTSPLIATTPLFGTVVAAVTLDEVPGLVEAVGMALIVVGVYVTQHERVRAVAVPSMAGGRRELPGPRAEAPGPPLRWFAFGLGAAFALSVSPIFIRHGLEEVNDPVLGVAVGSVVATVAFGVLLVARGKTGSLVAASRTSVAWKVLAGILVGLATWTRWYSLSLASVAAVLSLALVSVPTVLFLAPIVAGRHLERITVSIVIGSAFVVGGALVLIAQG